METDVGKTDPPPPGGRKEESEQINGNGMEVEEEGGETHFAEQGERKEGTTSENGHGIKVEAEDSSGMKKRNNGAASDNGNTMEVETGQSKMEETNNGMKNGDGTDVGTESGKTDQPVLGELLEGTTLGNGGETERVAETQVWPTGGMVVLTQEEINEERFGIYQDFAEQKVVAWEEAWAKQHIIAEKVQRASRMTVWKKVEPGKEDPEGSRLFDIRTHLTLTKQALFLKHFA